MTNTPKDIDLQDTINPSAWPFVNDEPRPPILDREPGPYAFVRSAEQIAQDAEHLAIDLRNERADNTIWDRD